MNKIISRVYLIFLLVILYLPIFYLILFAFNEGDNMGAFQGFSLGHFRDLFSDTRMISIVINTMLIAILSSLIATIIGLFGALFIDRLKSKRAANIYLSLNDVLLVSPDVIIGSSFLILFTVLGFSLGFMSVLLSHIAFSIPIVVLMILPRLQEMNKSMIDAAQDLGATRIQAFNKVVLPFLLPSILTGFFMAFTYSLDDFAVTFFVTGNGFETLSVEVYSQARQGVNLEINALSALIFGFSLIMIIIYYLLTVRNKKSVRVGKGRII
ncbi:spermidine/purescine ABC transporter permease [Companilactobacillus sp. RD055328]|uniref:ABC transporter permease n=1 Tax=Companilactobacillus sp. RD055328 TaxID=2916634 RepID=UPI001FC7FD82|nr:ABC transporter permease [Companilactobacillus sp. RD055328]GKQ43002.1 spermidine/purescine ABC transporter permease [Companilactobacillus sp. RD055328]